MTRRNGSTLISFLAGATSLALALAAIGLIVVYTGAYNIAATEEHASITRWAFDTTFHSSVERRAGSVALPERFTPRMVESGARMYQEMCQQCHAGPGVERASWARGMRPQPPHLTEEAAEWEPAEVFWLVKHGAKMTGMPAFGPTHDDDALWSIAAFVREMPAMTPERYAALTDGQGGPTTHDHGTH